MKQIFYLVLVTSTVSLFSTSSCKKDPLPQRFVSTGNYSGPNAYTADLLANDWARDANGFYVHTFRYILYPGAAVKVFLLTDSKEEQINQYIFFMGGQLWASSSNSDLKIYYRTSGPLPFSSLNIKVVIG